MEEVRKHRGAGDGSFWTVINNEVYDLTSFMKQHPGGHVIRLAAGIDASCLVESYHPISSNNKVDAAIKNKLVHLGSLKNPPKLKNKDFFVTVRQRCEDKLREMGSDTRYGSSIIIFEALLTFLAYLYSSYMVSIHASVFWAVVMGLVMGRCGFLMHTGNHCGGTRSVTFNNLMGSFMDLIGSSSMVWMHEHQVAHHMNPNELGLDNDCSIGDPILRFHPGLPAPTKQKWWMPYQHYVTIFGMGLGFFKWYVADVFNFKTGQVGSAYFKPNDYDWHKLLVFKIGWLFPHLFLPLYLHGVTWTLIPLVIYMVVGAHYLENTFIVNHIQADLVPDKDIHWANKQVIGTANWASGSHFWNWYSGGLNHQIEHHLFPAVNIYAYPILSPIVKQTCEEFGLPYVNFESFPEAWLAMMAYLKKLGEEGKEFKH